MKNVEEIAQELKAWFSSACGELAREEFTEPDDMFNDSAAFLDLIADRLGDASRCNGSPSFTPEADRQLALAVIENLSKIMPQFGPDTWESLRSYFASRIC
jgi:hypothetical protein